jgi:hypothetical protein
LVRELGGEHEPVAAPFEQLAERVVGRIVQEPGSIDLPPAELTVVF